MNKSEELNKEIIDIFEANNIDKVDLSMFSDDFKENFLIKIRELNEMTQILEKETIKLQDASNDLHIKANENNQNQTGETE